MSQEKKDLYCEDNSCHIAIPTTIKTKYTCPMHPEIIKDEEGNCPQCGMALEPITLEANKET